MKGARGRTALCIGLGGGQRCQKPGCNKVGESRTAYCKAHGGGRRCQHLGCTKSAEGQTEYCIAHDGGRRCSYPMGCSKAARGKSGLCIKHGGGKRCVVDGCTRMKVRWVCAFLMEEAGGVGSMGVTRGLRGGPCTVKLTVAVNVVCLPVVPKVLKVVLRFVKPTADESDAYMKEVGFAQKVCMGEPTFVWLMVVGRDVPWQVVPRALVAGLIAA